MTEFEYRELQDAFTNKMKKERFAPRGYDKGILACKSILKSVYEHFQRLEENHKKQEPRD